MTQESLKSLRTTFWLKEWQRSKFDIKISLGNPGVYCKTVLEVFYIMSQKCDDIQQVQRTSEGLKFNFKC